MLQLSLVRIPPALQISRCRLLGFFFFSAPGRWNAICWTLSRPLPRWGRKVWGVFGSGRQHQAGQGEGEGGDLLLPDQVLNHHQISSTNFLTNLTRIRKARPGLVANQEQYRLVYSLVEEALVCGDNSRSLAQLKSSAKQDLTQEFLLVNKVQSLSLKSYLDGNTFVFHPGSTKPDPRRLCWRSPIGQQVKISVFDEKM